MGSSLAGGRDAVRTKEEHTARGTRVCVVGLGDVGLELVLAFDGASYSVDGYDVDGERIATLTNGTDPIGRFGDEAIRRSDVDFHVGRECVRRADCVILAVPTPLSDETAALPAVEAAGRAVGSVLQPETTVVLESTVYPGGTEGVLLPALEAASGLTAGEGFFVAYSPERISPGDPERGLADVTKVVSGRTDAVTDDVAALYESVVDAGVVRAPSIRVAEAAKCVENIQRDVNIALVNEFAATLDAMGIDTGDVLDVAATKWNFLPFRPGVVGGRCLPVDPHHFIGAAERHGVTPELIATARRVNEAVPSRVVSVTLDALETRRCEVGAVGPGEDPPGPDDLLLLGATYKPRTTDVRRSGFERITAALEAENVRVRAFDPRADDAAVRDALGVAPLDELDLAGFDALLVGTAHPEFSALELRSVREAMNERPVVVDLPGLFAPRATAEKGLVYRRL